MDSRVQEAKGKFGKMMCSAAVLTTYKDLIGITEAEAMLKAAPMAGGRMETCGAILAAQEILKVKAPEKVDMLEELFEKKNGSTLCKELKGRTGGPLLRSCPGCVEDASQILEQLLG
ncbi:MAG: C_GCAxxG_C_C family protein [Clostridiales bacterium]|nr:C_GCAxxG_C_C family protein [Clostridiales bacterium]